MKKLIRASEDYTDLVEDYRRLRGYLKEFVEEAEDTLRDLSDEDEEVTKDEIIDLASQHMRDYFEDLDFRRLLEMYFA